MLNISVLVLNLIFQRLKISEDLLISPVDDVKSGSMQNTAAASCMLMPPACRHFIWKKKEFKWLVY